jgi:ArsR family transcriptional regulator
MEAERFLTELESFFLALADPTRLRILNLIGQDEISVGNLVKAMGDSQPKISRHLAYLRSSGLVSVRRDGKWMHYSLVRSKNEVARKILDGLLNGMAVEEQMQQERQRLVKICEAAPKSGGSGKKTAPQRRPKNEAQVISDIFPERGTEIDRISAINEEFEEDAAETAPYRREELETFLL